MNREGYREETGIRAGKAKAESRPESWRGRRVCKRKDCENRSDRLTGLEKINKTRQGQLKQPAERLSELQNNANGLTQDSRYEGKIKGR